MTAITRIALIGFGEVGVRLAQDLARAGASKITAFDTRFIDRNSPASRNLAQAEVAITGSALEAARGAQLIISAVTADQDVVAARSVTGGIEAGAYFMDLNSASPGRKQESAALIEAAGGRYVEAAVMSPIDPKRIASPMLLGGPHAADFLKDAAGIGFAGATVYADTVGPAAATNCAASAVVMCSATRRKPGKRPCSGASTRSTKTRSRSKISTSAFVTSPCTSSGSPVSSMRARVA